MKSTKTLDEIEALRVLSGEVTEVQKATDSASVDLGAYGVIEEIPFAYLCQEIEEGELLAHWAFEVEDEVLVEWNVPVVETPLPTKDSCRVVGFTDGVPRLCAPKYVLVAIRYKFFVAFYNCEDGRCFVPTGYDTDYIENTWSGTGWIYFEIKATKSMVEFIDAVMDGTSCQASTSAIEDVNESLSTVITYIGPTDIEVIASYGTTTAPLCLDNSVRALTSTGLDHSLTRAYHSVMWGKLLKMYFYDQSGTLLYNGESILPGGWRLGEDGILVKRSDKLSIYGPYYNWEVGESGSAHDEMCPCWDDLPAVDDPDCVTIPASIYGHSCGSYIGMCSNTRKAVYQGLGRGMFLQRSFAANWQVDKLLYLGSGETQVSVPTWAWLPGAEISQTFTPAAAVTKFSDTRLLSKSNGTVGYIQGERTGVDWNWGSESNFSYEASSSSEEPFFQYRAEERVGAAVAPYLIGSTWRWKNPKMRITSVYMQGLGYQVDQEKYFNVATEEETEFIKDSVYRKVTAGYKVYTARSCQIVTDGSSRRVIEPVVESEDSFESIIDKFTRSGSELVLDGKRDDNALLAMQLWDTYSGGWKSTGTAFTPSESILGLYSAARADSTEAGSEWAEGRVNFDASDWIIEYFERLCVVAGPPYNSLRAFVKYFAGNQLEFRVLADEE